MNLDIEDTLKSVPQRLGLYRMIEGGGRGALRRQSEEFE